MARLPIGVVVVTWNGYADTVACLASLHGAKPGPARIVVVDSGSDDGSTERLREAIEGAANLASRVTFLASTTNRGFAAAANLGIAALSADPGIGHFLLLNNDAAVRPDFFAEVARALEAAPGAALVGPTIYEANGSGHVWYAGGAFVPLRALAVHRHEVPANATAVPTEFVTGCAMLVSRRAHETLGPLPEQYFMYLEDAEYSHRALGAGLAVVYAPRAVVYHAVGAAVERAVRPARLAYWVTRGRSLFVRRNLRRWQRWGAVAYLLVTKPGRALAELLAGRPRVAWATLRGTLEGLLSEDGDLQARRAGASQGREDGVVVHQ